VFVKVGFRGYGVGEALIGFIWLRIGTRGGLLWAR